MQKANCGNLHKAELRFLAAAEPRESLPGDGNEIRAGERASDSWVIALGLLLPHEFGI